MLALAQRLLTMVSIVDVRGRIYPSINTNKKFFRKLGFPEGFIVDMINVEGLKTINNLANMNVKYAADTVKSPCLHFKDNQVNFTPDKIKHKITVMCFSDQIILCIKHK